MFGRKSNASLGPVRAQGQGSAEGGALALSEPAKALSKSAAEARAKRNGAGVSGIDGFVLVGKGTRITGQIDNCSMVEIEGTLEGDVSAGVVIVRPGGMLKGDVQAEQAEIYGAVDGRITVHGLLEVHATGRVNGEVTYETLAVAAGAHLSGQLVTPAAIHATGQPTTVQHTAGEPADIYSINGMTGGHYRKS